MNCSIYKEILEENTSLQFIDFEQLNLGPDETFNSLGITDLQFRKDRLEQFAFSIEFFMGNEEKVMYQFDGTVTLTDDNIVPLSITLPAFSENEAILIGSLGCRPKAFVSINISMRDIFANIDFDALGAGGKAINIQEGTKDPNIENALRQLQNNFFFAIQSTNQFFNCNSSF